MHYATYMNALVFILALGILLLAYMTFWYVLARITDRYDVVDSAWGLGFVFVAWVSLCLRANFGTLQVISAALVSVWGLRLFAHIANRNWRKHQDDHRYQDLRAAWGAAEHRKAYTNVFLMQGLLVAVVSTPMIALPFTHRVPNAVTYIGWFVWVFGIGFEALADRQLATFIARRAKGSHAIKDKGLWRFSRHPNYFGEVTTWWGAAIVAASTLQWWGIVGALVITLLITKVSGIPPLEKHYADNKDYDAYCKRTSVFVPLPPRSVPK